MRYNRLGRTGLFVSELCLGTMTFGQSKGRYAAASGVGQDAVEAILSRAVDAGVNFIDTADVYAEGQSEEIVGRAIRNLGIRRKDIVLATKFEHPTGPGPNDAGGSRKHIVDAVEASLKRLGTDHVDLYQMHGWDPATPVEETVAALDDLVRRGLVRYLGVSNWAAWQVATALGLTERTGAARFASYQGYYSLVGREIERDVLPALEHHGLSLIAFSPLAGGYLTGKYRNGLEGGRRKTIPFPPVDEMRGAKLLDAMEPIATAHETSLEAVALAWLRRQPAVASIITGVKSVEQLDANLRATSVELSGEEIETLGGIAGPNPEYPGWMLAQGSAARASLLATGALPGGE
ncbi:aldo/keto reductase [Aureimonas psammosilenae]|uniref:aldo/keto reductase n=1 Tax=Aureimonas psammosilenae TaxID=2495496 RepID=UPI0012610212|nr:aldo/keto reductase [Aureimonas psammosilenae]